MVNKIVQFRPLGVRGRSPRYCGDFASFFPKICIFRRRIVDLL